MKQRESILTTAETALGIFLALAAIAAGLILFRVIGAGYCTGGVTRLCRINQSMGLVFAIGMIAMLAGLYAYFVGFNFRHLVRFALLGLYILIFVLGFQMAYHVYLDRPITCYITHCRSYSGNGYGKNYNLK